MWTFLYCNLYRETWVFKINVLFKTNRSNCKTEPIKCNTPTQTVTIHNYFVVFTHTLKVWFLVEKKHCLFKMSCKCFSLTKLTPVFSFLYLFFILVKSDLQTLIMSMQKLSYNWTVLFGDIKTMEQTYQLRQWRISTCTAKEPENIRSQKTNKDFTSIDGSAASNTIVVLYLNYTTIECSFNVEMVRCFMYLLLNPVENLIL